jgi:hypothetical protein
MSPPLFDAVATQDTVIDLRAAIRKVHHRRPGGPGVGGRGAAGAGRRR